VWPFESLYPQHYVKCKACADCSKGNGTYTLIKDEEKRLQLQRTLPPTQLQDQQILAAYTYYAVTLSDNSYEHLQEMLDSRLCVGDYDNPRAAPAPIDPPAPIVTTAANIGKTAGGPQWTEGNTGGGNWSYNGRGGTTRLGRHPQHHQYQYQQTSGNDYARTEPYPGYSCSTCGGGPDGNNPFLYGDRLLSNNTEYADWTESGYGRLKTNRGPIQDCCWNCQETNSDGSINTSPEYAKKDVADGGQVIGSTVLGNQCGGMKLISLLLWVICHREQNLVEGSQGYGTWSAGYKWYFNIDLSPNCGPTFVVPNEYRATHNYPWNHEAGLESVFFRMCTSRAETEEEALDTLPCSDCVDSTLAQGLTGNLNKPDDGTVQGRDNIDLTERNQPPCLLNGVTIANITGVQI